MKDLDSMALREYLDAIYTHLTGDPSQAAADVRVSVHGLSGAALDAVALREETTHLRVPPAVAA